MTTWTEVTDQSTGFTEVADITQDFLPIGLFLRLLTEDKDRIQSEDLDYLIIENRQADIAEVGDQSTSYTEVADQSTSYTEVADV